MADVRILSVVGARPNFMKIAPFAHAIDAHNAAGSGPRVDHFIVHTGQHYDRDMSEAFFHALDIPPPDLNLEVGSGTHAQQVGNTMIAFEPVVRERRPDWIVVVGDVNATCACAITAKKEHVRLAHIEAGLRSGDMRMPEEINRMVTDRLSDLLLTPDALADANLAQEGTAPARIHRIGNVMIDTLEAHRAEASELAIDEIVASHRIPGSKASPDLSGGFAVMTLHRPSNVDDPDTLTALAGLVSDDMAAELPILLTLHPRTRDALQQGELWNTLLVHPAVVLLSPLGYREMLCMNMAATIMITDSGGLQEECCVLGTPCLTLRENTERPITLIEHGGVSRLVGNQPANVLQGFHELRQRPRQPFVPDGWDGSAAPRALAAILGV